MSYDLPTGEEAIKELKRELEILRDSIPVNTFFLGQEQANTGIGQLTDTGSKTAGITSYTPSIETLGAGADIGSDELQVTATTIIVDGSGNSLDLKMLRGTHYNGQILFIKPLKDKTLTLKPTVSNVGNNDVPYPVTMEPNLVIEYYSR